MKHHQFIFALLAACIYIGCRPIEDENHHYTIPFYNNTEADLYIDTSDRYPDTTVTNLYGGPNIKIQAQSVNSDGLRDYWVTYETIFRDGRQYPNDTLIVFVFDAKRLEEDRHHAENALLVRYDLSLQDLQRLNWMLSYPPTERMKDIKMWPKYENK